MRIDRWMNAIRRTLVSALLLALPLAAPASDAPFRVAVIGNSPPMSYVDEQGSLTGFNVAIAHALCAELKQQCQLVPVPLDHVVDAVAAGDFDFAAVSLLATPERRRKVLFSKPYYHSMSIWLGKPGIRPETGTATVAVVRGSAQARHAETQGWKTLPLASHTEVPGVLAAGQADAAVVPMPTALGLMNEKPLQPLGLKPTILSAPLLTGDVCISINPRRPELKERLDAAIDQIKRDGRYDRINTQFLPFRLQ